MRLLRMRQFVGALAIVFLLAAASAPLVHAGHTGDDGSSPTFVAGMGLLVLSGAYALANADYVARGRGNYVMGSLGLIVGAPIAGIGALALFRSLDADEVSTRNVLLSVGLITTGLASAILGGKSVALAICPPDKASKVTVSPALFADGERYRPGVVLRATF